MKSRSPSLYQQQFIDGLRFLAEINPEYREFAPDFEQIDAVISDNRAAESQEMYTSLIENALAPLAEVYLRSVGGCEVVAHRCHGMSQGLYELWRRHSGGDAFSLSVTVGNVYFKEQNIYELSKSKLLGILNDGRVLDQTLDVHVWLTLDNMTVLDPSIISTLTAKGLLGGKTENLALFWTEEAPGDFHFEPLLVDNDFFHRVDQIKLI